MSVTVLEVETPAYVVSHGWRDVPITGPDSCAECEGSGCRRANLRNGKPVHRTCPQCMGKGWT